MAPAEAHQNLHMHVSVQQTSLQPDLLHYSLAHGHLWSVVLKKNLRYSFFIGFLLRGLAKNSRPRSETIASMDPYHCIVLEAWQGLLGDSLVT